jgi:acetyl-CoA carboxylase carboxyl transferase subunit beta
MSARERIDLLTDKGSFQELNSDVISWDFLNFKDKKPYKERLEEAKQKTNLQEAIITGVGKIYDRKIVLSILEFDFMGGSMGAVVGEKFTQAVEYAKENNSPLVSVTSSGGARMQEGMISLMQMAKTVAITKLLADKRIPYISVLTNPTTGGVSASFAMLADVIIAEPKALIGFAGPRVIEETTGEKLPENFQRAEFLLEHGFIDMIVERKYLKETICKIIDLLFW